MTEGKVSKEEITVLLMDQSPGTIQHSFQNANEYKPNWSIYFFSHTFLRLNETPKAVANSKHLKGHLAPRVSHVTFLDQRVIPGSL